MLNVTQLFLTVCSLSATTEPKPETAPSSQEPSPPASGTEAVATSETTELPSGCLHTFFFPLHLPCMLSNIKNI